MIHAEARPRQQGPGWIQAGTGPGRREGGCGLDRHGRAPARAAGSASWRITFVGIGTALTYYTATINTP